MGKLFNAIKDKYDGLVKFQYDQQKNFIALTTYDNIYKKIEETRYVNFFFNEKNVSFRLNFSSFFGKFHLYVFGRRPVSAHFSCRTHRLPFRIFPKGAHSLPSPCGGSPSGKRSRSPSDAPARSTCREAAPPPRAAGSPPAEAPGRRCRLDLWCAAAPAPRRAGNWASRTGS